ncbi:MAG: homoserine dehydrogenase, partial [Christensenellales bacterium]
DGFDACRKICILAAIASGKMIPMDKVRVRGIREITQEHIAKANEMGARIRLVARAVLPEDGCVCLSVEPYYVRRDNPLYGVDDVFNAVSVTGDSVGEVMFYGKGAGKLPTASAVVADVLDIVARGDSFAADENIMFTVAPEAYSDKLPEKYALSTEQTLGTPVFA